MNRAEADAAEEALRTLVAKLNLKRAAGLVVADQEQVLTELVDLAETAAAVVNGAAGLAADTFAADTELVAQLTGRFRRGERSAAAAASGLLAARTVLRTDVREHSDAKPPGGSRRSPWVGTQSARLVTGPAESAIAAVWALRRDNASGDASDLATHWSLYGGLARVMAQLWAVCLAEEPNIGGAYFGLGMERSRERAQEAVRGAGAQWHRTGMEFLEMLAILRRRARQGGPDATATRALVTTRGAYAS